MLVSPIASAAVHPYIMNLIKDEAEQAETTVSQIIRKAIYTYYAEVDGLAAEIKTAEDLLWQLGTSLVEEEKKIKTRRR